MTVTMFMLVSLSCINDLSAAHGKENCDVKLEVTSFSVNHNVQHSSYVTMKFLLESERFALTNAHMSAN